MTAQRKPTKKPPTPKDKKQKVYERVECYLSPKVIQYCKNLVANGGNKQKALREAGLNKNYNNSKTYKKNIHIPKYIEQLKNEFLEYDNGEGRDSDTYVDHIKKNIGKVILKRLVDTVNFRLDRVQRWDNTELEIYPSEDLSPEDISAIKSITYEKTEFHGKNPRTTFKMKIDAYDANQAMKEIRDMVGLDFKKDQDSTYLIEQLKTMLVDQKREKIFPTMPNPETDPSLLNPDDGEETSVSDMTKH